MDRNWNRGGSGSGASAGGEKMFRHPYSGGQNNYNNYRKKNDFSGPEYYSKNAKPVLAQAQPVKKEALQVVLVENELMDIHFSWVKNGGTNVQ
jgi:hypothetical protein